MAILPKSQSAPGPQPIQRRQIVGNTSMPSSVKTSPRETSVRILDAAEQLFAVQSFEGTSIRQITDLAGVRLALAHYHFESKEHIFHEVLTRRANVVNDSRQQLLAHYRQLHGQEPLSVEDIARCYLSPYLYWSTHGGPGWQSYTKLAARLMSTERWMGLLDTLFTPLAEDFLQELRRTFPSGEEKRIQWAFDFMVGVMSNTFSENNRIEALSGGLCSCEDRDDACGHLIPFVVAGVNASIHSSPVSFQKDFSAIGKAAKASDMADAAPK